METANEWTGLILGERLERQDNPPESVQSSHQSESSLN